MDTYNFYDNVHVYSCQCKIHIVYAAHLMCARYLTELSMPGGVLASTDRGPRTIYLVTFVVYIYRMYMVNACLMLSCVAVECSQKLMPWEGLTRLLITNTAVWTMYLGSYVACEKSYLGKAVERFKAN